MASLFRKVFLALIRTSLEHQSAYTFYFDITPENQQSCKDLLEKYLEFPIETIPAPSVLHIVVGGFSGEAQFHIKSDSSLKGEPLFSAPKKIQVYDAINFVESIMPLGHWYDTGYLDSEQGF